MSPVKTQLKAIAELLDAVALLDSEQEQQVSIKACLKLLDELKEQENSDQAEINYLQGCAWYISSDSEERDSKVLAHLSAALELDFEHVKAKVYLCHYLFDIGDYQEFLKHYQQLNISQFIQWRKLKFLEMHVIARIAIDDYYDAIGKDYISRYENSNDDDQVVMHELINFSLENKEKIPNNLITFINKWMKYWGWNADSES